MLKSPLGSALRRSMRRGPAFVGLVLLGAWVFTASSYAQSEGDGGGEGQGQVEGELVCLASVKREAKQIAYARTNLPAVLAERVSEGKLLEGACKRETILASLTGAEKIVAAPQCNPPDAARKEFCERSAALKQLLERSLADLDAAAGG